MATTTVRVRPDTRDRLDRLAQEEHLSAADMLDRLVERDEQDRLLRAMNDDFERLRGDEPAWAEFKTETRVWEATSADPAPPLEQDRRLLPPEITGGPPDE